MTIREKFSSLRTKEDVAMLLDIKISMLNYMIGKRRISSYYKSFQIIKKNGKMRDISAPNKELMKVQKQLSIYLNALYDESVKSNAISHGFRKYMSIKTNATRHFGSTYLLNIDLEDFFDTINYSRIKALFVKGFNVGDESAKILSLILCYNGRLPQGSPCSPIISNMICKRLDSDLYNFGRKYRLRVTRYADDITISATDQSSFNNAYYWDNISDELQNIIKSNGFSINNSKTRASFPKQRKEVTGLIINEKLNVRRSFVRYLRAQIHELSSLSLTERRQYMNEIRGKIEFISQIKGKDDSVYIRYADRYNKLFDEEYFDIQEDRLDTVTYIKRRLRVVGFDLKVNGEILKDAGNGTSFIVKLGTDYYYVSCYHVIEKSIDECCAFRFYNLDEEFVLEKEMGFNYYYDRMEELCKFNSEDFFLIKLDYIPKYYFEIENQENLIYNFGVKVQICGYPSFNFLNNDNYSRYENIISSSKLNCYNTSKSIEIIGVNNNIPHGVSGGPVLNDRMKIIGIASNGVDYHYENRGKVIKPGFIPISRLIELVQS